MSLDLKDSCFTSRSRTPTLLGEIRQGFEPQERHSGTRRAGGVLCCAQVTSMAVVATPEDERNYGVENGGVRSRIPLAARPRK
jgi:hypothetical protein